MAHLDKRSWLEKKAGGGEKGRGLDQAQDTGNPPRAKLLASQPGLCGPGSDHGEPALLSTPTAEPTAPAAHRCPAAPPGICLPALASGREMPHTSLAGSAVLREDGVVVTI